MTDFSSTGQQRDSVFIPDTIEGIIQQASQNDIPIIAWSQSGLQPQVNKMKGAGPGELNNMTQENKGSLNMRYVNADGAAIFRFPGYGRGSLI